MFRFIVIPEKRSPLLARCQNDLPAVARDNHLLHFFSLYKKKQCCMVTAADEAIKDNCLETENN